MCEPAEAWPALARIPHSRHGEDAHSGYSAIAIFDLDEGLALGHNLTLNQDWTQ
ncbi:MAG: hypothetical protein AB8V19_04990 [Candidatus Midichloria sp.]